MEGQSGELFFYFVEALLDGGVVFFFAKINNIPVGLLGAVDDFLDGLAVVVVFQEGVVHLDVGVVADAEMEADGVLQREVLGAHHFLFEANVQLFVDGLGVFVEILVGLEVTEQNEIVLLLGERGVVEVGFHVAGERARFQVGVEAFFQAFEHAVPVRRALVFVPFVGRDDQALFVLDGVGEGRVQLKELVP